MTRLRALFLLPASVLALAACDPQALADDVARRAANSVVLAVVQADLPAGPAQVATTCILDNATKPEIEALARDVGVVAGTLTRANIRTVALRPATQGCFAANNLPPVL